MLYQQKITREKYKEKKECIHRKECKKVSYKVGNCNIISLGYLTTSGKTNYSELLHLTKIFNNVGTSFSNAFLIS